MSLWEPALLAGAAAEEDDLLRFEFLGECNWATA